MGLRGRFKAWRVGRRYRRIARIPWGALGLPYAPQPHPRAVRIQFLEASEQVTPQLAEQVRPYLVAAVEAGYGRLWMLREVGLRRERLNHSASRIQPPRPRESPQAYRARLDRYTRALLPRKAWAGSARLPVTPRIPTTYDRNDSNATTVTHARKKRKNVTTVPWAVGGDADADDRAPSYETWGS